MQPLQLPELADKLEEQFEFLSELGRGGMGTVYLAREKSTGKHFAIKLVNQDLVNDPRCIKQFEHETQAVRKLNHANLVAVYESGLSLKGVPWILMDYIEGKDLASIIVQQGHLPVDDGLAILLQICDGLEYAHGKGIVHRDLKPSNIIVTAGKGNFVKIVDFGIAKILTPFETKGLTTQTEDVIGSPNYMSPEQCQGEQLDERSDIYSLGCVIYEMFSGKAPFAHKNQIKTILDHIRARPKPLAVRFPTLQIPPALDAVVLKCLSKKPLARYQSALELREDLALISSGKQPKRARSNVFSQGFGPGQWKGITVVAVGAATICGAAVWLQFIGGREPKPADAKVWTPLPAAVLQTQGLPKDAVTLLIDANIDFSLSFSLHHAPPVKRLVHVEASELKEIRKHPQTTSVGFRNTDAHDSAIEYLEGLSLEKIDLSDCPFITSAAGQFLRKLNSLNYLDLSCDNITPQTFRDIAKLPLRTLYIAGTNLSDLSPLLQFKSLHCLNLEDCQFLNDQSFATLAKMPIELLYLGGDDLTDSRTRSLTKMKSLKLLSLPDTNVTDQHVAQLSASLHLLRLNIDRTSVTDKSVDSLRKMSSLVELNLDGCDKVSPGAVARLRLALPTCDITTGQRDEAEVQRRKAFQTKSR